MFEDALLACVETELGAVESVLVTEGAFHALLGVVNFAEVVAVVATFIASSAAFVWSSIRGVVVVTLVFALAPQSAPIRHQVLEADVVGVLPTSSAVQTVTLQTSSTRVVTAQNWDHNILYDIRDVEQTSIRIGIEIEAIIFKSTIIRWILHTLKHNRDFGGVGRSCFEHFSDGDGPSSDVDFAVA